MLPNRRSNRNETIPMSKRFSFRGNVRFVRTLLSFAPVSALGLLIIFLLIGTHGHQNGIAAGALLLVLFTLARQILAMRENSKLYRHLQSAYAELKASQDELRDNNAIMMAANAQLEALATTDGLTGLANHRAFQMRLQDEMARVQRYGPGLAVVLVDVDYFKHYNDSYGHPAGDDILRGVGQLLNAHLRETDFVARYGGEEFALLLPETDLETSRAIAERMREIVANFDFPHRQITLSLGLAWHPSGQAPNEEIVVEADKALYTAKRNGRNCLVVASEIPHSIPEQEAQSASWVSHLTIDQSHMETALPVTDNPEALLQEPAGQLLCGLLAALDQREAEPEGHSMRVVRFALRLANEVMRMELEERCLTPGDLREVSFGALLHDIGKTSLPDSILRKTSPLTDEEIDQMQQHPIQGVAILEPFHVMAPALPVVLHHHERWDGRGYPHGLAGEDIPIAARIFAIADALDAMSKHRASETTSTDEEICEEIFQQAGRQFDPILVRAFLQIPVEEWEHLRHATPQTVEADVALPKAA